MGTTNLRPIWTRPRSGGKTIPNSSGKWRRASGSRKKSFSEHRATSGVYPQKKPHPNQTPTLSTPHYSDPHAPCACARATLKHYYITSGKFLAQNDPILIIHI